MEKLTVEKTGSGIGTDTMRISGFTDSEFAELRSMEHKEATEKVLEMLDARNGKLGSCWAQGYGVYGMWFGYEAVFMTVGNSCD